MVPKVYFDTSVWISPYDDWRDETTVLAVQRIIEAHKDRRIQLCTSRQVIKELQELLKNPDKSSKAQRALTALTSLNLLSLPYTPGIFGKAVFGEAIFDQETKFSDSSLKEPDREIAEFITANNVDFFASVDSDFFNIKKDIESRLQREHTSVVTPDQLCNILNL